MFRSLIGYLVRPIVGQNLVSGVALFGATVIMLLGFRAKNIRITPSSSDSYDYENQVSKTDNQQGLIKIENEGEVRNKVLEKGYSNKLKDEGVLTPTSTLPQKAISKNDENDDNDSLTNRAIGGNGIINTSEKSQVTNKNSDPQISPTITPTSPPSLNSDQIDPTPTPEPTPVPTEYSFPTPTQALVAIVSPTPTLTPAPTPTSNSTPTETKSTLLFSYNPVVRNADGEITITAKKNPNGYWDFIVSGSFRFLQPNRSYQLWLCQANGLDCSSHTSAKFTTDGNGSASLSNATINYPQGKYPLAKVLVWELEKPEDGNGCFPHTGVSPCLESSISF